MEKQSWTKPELIVLLRNHPEETMQNIGCKSPAAGGGPLAPTNQSCSEVGSKCSSSNNKS